VRTVSAIARTDHGAHDARQISLKACPLEARPWRRAHQKTFRRDPAEIRGNLIAMAPSWPSIYRGRYIGNVAGFVQLGSDKIGVIGGAALSPPELVFDQARLVAAEKATDRVGSYRPAARVTRKRRRRYID
jgi:hypothetical protein